MSKWSVNDYLEEHRVENTDVPAYGGEVWLELRPWVSCADGFRMSVQASRTHYCSPRISRGPYSAVEVGYPSERPPDSWGEYFDGIWQVPGIFGTLARLLKNRRTIWYAIKYSLEQRRIGFLLRSYLSLEDNATNSVYAYIPVGLVEELIEEHGGIAETAPNKEEEDD